MNEQNFIRRVDFFPTGDSYLAEKEISLSAVRDASSFQAVVGQAAGAVAATGVLTITDQPDDLDEIRIGPYTYTFDVTTLNDLPFHVLIAATAQLTLDNLVDAVNNTGTEGTDYGTLTPQNPAVSAGTATATTITFTARVAGEQGNSIPTAGVGGPGNDGLSGQSWSEATFGADALTGGSGSPLDATVIPTVVQDGLSFADGETALVQFTIPQDYHQSGDGLNDRGDRCALRFHVRPDGDSADTTDIGITTAQRITRAGVAIDATASTARAETATASTGQLGREFIADLSGRDYQPGDTVQLTIDVNAAGAVRELILSGMDLIYSTSLAAYNDDDRFRALGTAEV